MRLTEQQVINPASPVIPTEVEESPSEPLSDCPDRRQSRLTCHLERSREICYYAEGVSLRFSEDPLQHHQRRIRAHVGHNRAEEIPALVPDPAEQQAG